MSTRLQIHSASIKAAVSSLLDRNIFWDVSAQQEFLEAISQSVDDISTLMTHVALANLLQVGNLEMTRKPYELQEILTAVAERVLITSGKRLEYHDRVAKGSLILVDYKYFVHALATLIAVVGVTGDSEQFTLQDGELEGASQYILAIERVSPQVGTVAGAILNAQWASRTMQNGLPAEKVFELLLAIRLLIQQGVTVLRDDTRPDVLRIAIPPQE